MKRKYGLSADAYQRLVVIQQSACAICKREVPLHVDHCHASEKVRGLLCGKCNRGLGMFNDSAELLAAAQNYLNVVKE